MNTKFIIEVLMSLLMIIALGLIFQNLLRRKQGIGENVIQFTSIAFIIPAIVILGLEEVIQKETVAALLSGLGGYGLSSSTIGRKTPPSNDPTSPKVPETPVKPVPTVSLSESEPDTIILNR